MHDKELSASNQWLGFTDDQSWPQRPSPENEKLLRSMLCQQLLFTETAIVPDSWWLTNLQLRAVLKNGTDLHSAVREGFIAVASEQRFSDSGLSGRLRDQLDRQPKDRLEGLLTGPEQERFLRSIDDSGSFVFYDGKVVGKFFSNIIRLLVHSPEYLRSFGLADVQPTLVGFVQNRSPELLITSSHLKRIFTDPLLQRRVVEMSRPIYLINAPLNYGYHIAIGHDERNRLYRSVLRLLDSLRSNIHEAHLFQPSEIRELLSPVHIDDSIFKDAGMLRFDEINDARAVHFGKFKTTFVEFCEGAVDTLDLEEAYRSYQSNLKGHLTRRNARFDMIVAKSARTLATTSAYVGKIAPPFAAAATGFQVPESYYVQVTLGLLAQLLQRGLEAFAGAKEARANLVGTRKLLTRLQAWTHTEGIDRNASWQDHSPN